MNGRQASLPDLLSQKRRGSATSLSEGLAGARPSSAFQAASKQVAPRHNLEASRPKSALQYLRQLAASSGSVQTAGSAWRQSVVPAAGESCGPVDPTGKSGIPQSLTCEALRYYRARHQILDATKNGRRAPQHAEVELRQQEHALAVHLRPMHPTFFHRFDQQQLERLLRAMPFLRLTEGRWVFGDESLEASWPAAKGGRAFLLLGGSVALFQSSVGQGPKTEFNRVALFAERPFCFADDSLEDYVGGSARAREACIVGVLSLDLLEAAFSDRYMGNRRIAQVAQQMPAFRNIVAPTEDLDAEKGPAPVRASGPALLGLQELSKVASALHIRIGQELLLKEQMEDALIIVAKGSVAIRGDVRLVENLSKLRPKKTRLKVFLEKATNLAGDSIFDKLDPFCIVRLGERKKFQTPVVWNAGVNVTWNYSGAFVYADEEELEFLVMDRDDYSADDLCGTVNLRCADIPDGGCSLRLGLERAKAGILADESKREVAGQLFVRMEWEMQQVSAANHRPKVEDFPDQELFLLGVKECWGHEQLMMGNMFMRTLELCAGNLAYAPQIGNLRIVGAETPGQTGANDMVTLWKVTRDRFTDFVQICSREKEFTNACRQSMLDKSSALKEKIVALIQKAHERAQTALLSLQEQPQAEQPINPATFQRLYQGQRCHVVVRSAASLHGGSMWDKLDPYAVARFKGSRQEMRTSVLQDAGSDPMWNCEGHLWYSGETSLQIAVYDYDRVGEDTLLGTGSVDVGSFMEGFEGMVGLDQPPGRAVRAGKQMQICISVAWDPLQLEDTQPSQRPLQRRPSRGSLQHMARVGR